MASALQLKACGILSNISGTRPVPFASLGGGIIAAPVGCSSSVLRRKERGLDSRLSARSSVAFRGKLTTLRKREETTMISGIVRVMVAEAAEGSPEDRSIAVEDVEDVVEDEETPEDPEVEEDRQNIRDILRVVELLRTKRDMTFNEVRLTIMIEDPRDVERRKLLNIEDDRGCSREEMGAALIEVNEGRVPQDRITLRELAKEMWDWPNLEDEINPQDRTSPIASPYAKVTDTGVDPKVAAERARVDWDTAAEIQPGEEKKDLSEVLPPVVGFSFLYLVSGIPIIIGITVVVILFLNSLQ